MMNRETLKGAKIEVQTEGMKEYYVTFRSLLLTADSTAGPCRDHRFSDLYCRADSGLDLTILFYLFVFQPGGI